MSTLLTQRALRVFAVLEHYRAGSPDILDALLPFFEPILAEFKGQTLDQEAFALRVRESYRWNFTADIVEELIPRFQNRGWVREIAHIDNLPAYQVLYDNPIAAPAGANEIKISELLLSAAQEFKAFIDKISPLTSVAKPVNELADTLIEWLVSIDAYSEEVLRQHAIKRTYVDGKLGIAVDLADLSSLESEERYLCARFVKYLFDQKSPIIGDLCKLASVGLLTEVIQDFQKPVTQVKRTNLNVYLDAPVALDLLGVSGRAAAANIRPIIAKLQQIGASVRIFRISVDELQHALDAVLKRSPPERTGPTADAMRRNQVAEAYVRQIATDPDSALAELKVGIVQRTLDQFPNEHEYFTREHYEQLFSKMTWHFEMPRREHDTSVIAHIMRMRGATQTRDLFQSKHLLITRNGALAQLARKFAVDQGLISSHAIGPAIHQRQLATAAWLRTGLSDTGDDVPKTYLLAACERVLELKKGIVDQVRITARNLTPEIQEQLELLLTQDRSVQMLMDKTLGVSSVVSSTNIESLVDSMRSTLTEEVRKDSERTLTAAKREAAAKVREAHGARRSAEKQAADLDNKLNTIGAEDRAIVGRLLSDVNRDIRRHRTRLKAGAGLAAILIGALPFLTDSMSGMWRLLVFLLGGAIGATLAFLQLLDRPTGLDAAVDKFAMRRLNTIATRRGISAKLARCETEYRDGQFRYID